MLRSVHAERRMSGVVVARGGSTSTPDTIGCRRRRT